MEGVASKSPSDSMRYIVIPPFNAIDVHDTLELSAYKVTQGA
jgi:hypothetical protein